MLNCKCEIAPIIRFINTKLFDGEINVFLDQFQNQLNCDGALTKLNSCLSNHGFIGAVVFIDGHFIYLKEEVAVEILVEGNIELPSKFVEVEHGEWSHTMNKIKKVKDIKDIKFKAGDIVFVASEGTYSKYRYTK